MKKFNFLFILLLLAFGIFAQNTYDSNWLRFQRGKANFDNKNYGEALADFRSCIASELITENSVPETLFDTIYNDIVKRLENENRVSFFKNCYLKSSRKNYYKLHSDLSKIERIQLANMLKDIGFKNVYPEAYFYIGKIYKLEGEYLLAEKNFNSALSQIKSLQIEDTLFEIYYELIDLYSKWDKPNEFLKSTNVLLEFDPLFYDKKVSSVGKNMSKVFLDKSLFKAIELYRLTNDKFIKAYSLLADYYYDKEDYNKYYEYSFDAVVTILSIIAEEMKKSDYEYVFTDIEELLEDALKFGYLKDFIISSNLFMNMYKLGNSLELQGNIYKAQSIYWLCLNFDEAGTWGNKASEASMKISFDNIDFVEEPKKDALIR